LYQWVRERGLRWNNLEKLLPERTANAIKNRWYAILQKREQALMRDTETMLNIRYQMRHGMPIPEICKGGFPLPDLDDPVSSAIEE
jgi:hypothetical protein